MPSAAQAFLATLFLRLTPLHQIIQLGRCYFLSRLKVVFMVFSLLSLAHYILNSHSLP